MGSGMELPWRPLERSARNEPTTNNDEIWGVGILGIYGRSNYRRSARTPRGWPGLYCPAMGDLLGSVNGPLEREAPEIFRALSPLGRRVVLTPGDRGPAPAAADLLPALRRALGGLSQADRDLALSPSPVTG